MSDPAAAGSAQPPPAEPGGYAPSVAQRFSAFQRAGGLVVPLITTLLAFLIGRPRRARHDGAQPALHIQGDLQRDGPGWFFHPGNYSIGVPFTDTTVWFPLNTNSLKSHDAYTCSRPSC